MMHNDDYDDDENGRLMSGWAHTSFHTCCFDSSLDNIWTLANLDCGNDDDNDDDDDGGDDDGDDGDDKVYQTKVVVLTPASITFAPLANRDCGCDGDDHDNRDDSFNRLQKVRILIILMMLIFMLRLISIIMMMRSALFFLLQPQ